MANSSTSKSREPFFVLCGVVLVTACLYWARQVLVPVALAVLLAFALTPAVSALQRRGLPRLPAVLTVVLLALVLLGGAGYAISRQIDTFVSRLPVYKGRIISKIETLRGAGSGGWLGTVNKTWKDISDKVEKKGGGQPGGEAGAKAEESGEGIQHPAPNKAPGTDPDNPLYVQGTPSGWSHISDMIGPAAEGLGDAFLVLVLVIFMLIQRENLRNRCVRLIGHGRLIVTTQAFDEGAQRISKYLLMQLLINTLFGVILAVGLFATGLVTGQRELWHYALLCGFLAAVLRFVPYVGTWVAAALVTLFSVAVLDGWALPLGVFGFFVVIELLTANVVEPLLFGHSTGVSPLALLLAAAFWTWLWGPVGLVLSTPLTVTLVVLGKYVPELHFFEVLLGDEPVLSTDVTFYQRLVARDPEEATDLVEDYLREHPPEAVYEDVLLPALLHAKRDRDKGELEADTYEYVLQGIRDALEDLSAALSEQLKEVPGERKALALGCPGRDEADELALEMLAQMIRLRGYAMEVVSSKKLTAEVLEHLGGEGPILVCVGSLPPGGLSQVRYLCKRIRLQAPNVKIVVGRWGDADKTERTGKRLHAAGADQLAPKLSASRDQILPLLQVAANAGPAADKPAEVAAGR